MTLGRRAVAYFRLSAMATCAAGLIHCVERDTTPTARGLTVHPATPPARPARPLLPGQVRVPADRHLAWIRPEEAYLPPWKTRWEQALEARRGLARSARGGWRLADAHATYRDTMAHRFFVTAPPTTAGFRMPAEY